ncbi:MAG: hypothetical protein D6712_17875 [Chloroflexi bacterium]|nr:MAG: hypothetical protein D6712_17875 [Chloroflexota bacterium]
MTIEHMFIELTLKDKLLNEKLQAVSKKLDQIEREFGDVGRAGDKAGADTSKRWSQVIDTLNGSAQTLTVAGGAVAGLFALTAREAMGAETANLNLTKSVVGANQSFGDSIGTMDSWQSTVEDMQKQLKVFTTSELRNAVSLTIDSTKRYGLNEEQMKRLILATANLGAGKEALQESLMRTTAAIRGEAEASEFLGLTLNENYVMSQLASLGITKLWKDMNDAEKAAARFELLMRQAADAEGKLSDFAETGSGKLQQLRVDLNDLAVDIGGTLLPLLESYMDAAKGAIDGAQHLRDWNPILIDTITRIAGLEAGLIAAGGAALLLAGHTAKAVTALRELGMISQLRFAGSFGIYGLIAAGIFEIATAWVRAKTAKDEYFIETPLTDQFKSLRSRAVEKYTVAIQSGEATDNAYRRQFGGDLGNELKQEREILVEIANDMLNQRAMLHGKVRERTRQIMSDLIRMENDDLTEKQQHIKALGEELFTIMDRVIDAQEELDVKQNSKFSQTTGALASGSGGSGKQATADEVIEHRRRINEITTTEYIQYWSERLAQTSRGSKEELQIMELLYNESQQVIEEYQQKYWESQQVQMQIQAGAHQAELMRLTRRLEQSHIFFDAETRTVSQALNIISETREEHDRLEIQRIAAKIDRKMQLSAGEVDTVQQVLEDLTRMRETADQAEYNRLVARLQAQETLSAQEIDIVRNTVLAIAALRQDASSSELIRVSDLIGVEPLSESDLSLLSLPELSGIQRRGRVAQQFDIVRQIQENPAQGLSFMDVDTSAGSAGIDELIEKTLTFADLLGMTADEASAVGQRIASDLAGGIRQALFEGQSFGSAMRGVMRNLIADLTQAVIKALLLKTVFAAFGFGSGASFGQLVFQGMGFMHQGGQVPEDVQMKRFHSGGQVTAMDFPTLPIQLNSLQRGEVPIIAQEGEIILNAMQQRNVAAAVQGGKQVHYHDQRVIKIGQVFGEEKDRLRRWVRDELTPVLDES